MALEISNIPVLTGDEAENFVRKTIENESSRGANNISKDIDYIKDFETNNSSFISNLKSKGLWIF